MFSELSGSFDIPQLFKYALKHTVCIHPGSNWMFEGDELQQPMTAAARAAVNAAIKHFPNEGLWACLLRIHA